MIHKNLVILAGGASSRMKKSLASSGLTDPEIDQANSHSKGLIGVDDKQRPLLDYLLYNAKRAGYKNIYIVIGQNDPLFKNFYGKKRAGNNFHGLDISFAIQYIPKGRIKPFGTADALFQAIEQYPELNSGSYAVCNSDNLYSVRALLALSESRQKNAFISYDREALEFSSQRISNFALVVLKDDFLCDITEKPPLEKITDYKDASGKLRVSMNIFKFDASMFYPYLKSCPVHPLRCEKELPSALLNMIKDYPRSVLGIPFSEHVPDMTVKEDILIMRSYLKKHYPKLNWQTD